MSTRSSGDANDGERTSYTTGEAKDNGAIGVGMDARKDGNETDDASDVG